MDSVSRLENIAYYILLVAAFLLPIFFIPSASFPFQFSKIVFVSLTVLVSFALWLIARLKDGKYLLPNNSAFIAAGLVILAVLLSTLTSPALSVSFIGQGFEIGTWTNVVILFLVMFLFSALFRPKERVFYLYLSLFASSFLIVVFHALRFVFGPQFLSFGIFTDITSNLIGKWNDLGIFFGLVALLSLITLELMEFNQIFKVLLWIVFVLSVISLIIVNFPTLWYVLAALCLFYFVYAYAFKRDFSAVSSAGTVEEEMSSMQDAGTSSPVRRWRGSILALILIVISVALLTDYYTPSRNFANWVSGKFNIAQLEVRPNWTSTTKVAIATLKSDPVFGSGPNRFVNEWLMNKPEGINQSIFWNTDFSFGIGYLPTQLISSGIVGFLAWLAFILSIVYLGVKNLLTPITDRLHRYLSVSSFFASLFLWTFFIFYIPSAVILTLTFLFTGVFIASLYNERLLRAKTISFTDESRVGFVSALVLTAFLVGVVALSYGFGRKFVASAYFQGAGIAFNNEGNADKAETLAVKAASLSKNDLYDRFLAVLTLNKINTLLSNPPTGVSADQIRSDFQSLMGKALNYARAATELDKTNYQDWVSLGRVYEAVVPLNIQGAYESAKTAYDQASLLNPHSPEIELIKARLELARNDRTKAKEHIDAALKMKNNYTEAIFLLSQIQAADGKVKDAIASVESAAVLAPNDPTVFFQLGLLKYNAHDYRGSVQALERAVFLAPSYSNAKYFLGLGYYQIGKTSNALTQFNDILTLNPGNADIPVIIKNIQNGRDPFSTLKDSEKPDKRETLPVEEKPVKDE